MGEDVSADQPVLARADVLSVEIEGVEVLFDPVERRAHVLNRSAATIWGMLRSPAAPDDLVRTLVDQLGVAPATAAHDVGELLHRLRSEDLVRAAGHRPRPTTSPAGPPATPRGPAGAFRSCTFEVLDRLAVVASVDRAVVDAVDWFAAPLAVDGVDRGGPDALIVAVEPGPDVERSVPARLNRLAADSTSCVVLHAAGIVVGSSAVALTGEPGSGKSTLVTALVERGWGYVSDEAVGLRPNLEIVGYPKRIALELGSWPLFPGLAALESSSRPGFDPTRVRWVDARELHADALRWARTDPLPRLEMVVAPTFRAGAELNVRRLPPVDALLSLLADNFNVCTVGAVALDTLRRVALEVPVYRVEHGGIDVAVPALMDLVAREGLTAGR